MNLWPSGRCTYGGNAPGMSSYVQAAQIAFAIGTPGVMLGPCNHDADLRDSAHQTGKAYRTSGVRGAIAILAQLKVAGYEDIEMPRVMSCSRSGATFVLNTNADLFPHSHTATIACSGVQAWDDAWAGVPVASVSTLGTQVRIDFAYSTGAHVAYQRGINQSIDRLFFTKIKGVWFPLTPVSDKSQFHS